MSTACNSKIEKTEEKKFGYRTTPSQVYEL